MHAKRIPDETSGGNSAVVKCVAISFSEKKWQFTNAREGTLLRAGFIWGFFRRKRD